MNVDLTGRLWSFECIEDFIGRNEEVGTNATATAEDGVATK
jgi:hypothetical protein